MGPLPHWLFLTVDGVCIVPLDQSNSSLRGVEGGDRQGDGGDATCRLLRQSHMFASAVREVLEEQLLHEVSPSRLTFAQFHVLKLMSGNGHHQVGELAEFLGVTPPAASKNIEKLVRLGLVVRKASAEDRRVTALSVSPEGRRLVEAYETMKESRLSVLLERFGEGEVEGFCDLLERLTLSLLGMGLSPRGACLRCAAYVEPGCPVGVLRGGCPYGRAGSGGGV